MITELSIRNFAIIDDISITFHEGLTVLTGETGAGKSIIIDAVTLLTGSRASVDFIRHGEKKAEISGLFSIDPRHKKVHEVCQLYGIDLDDDMLVLERTITHKGKSICRINGKIVTLTILRKLGEMLANIHSQHDTAQLMDSRTHIELLDAYYLTEIEPIKIQYQEKYNQLKKLQTKYQHLTENEQEMAHRLDLLQFQLHELTEANLTINEDETLSAERNELANYEKIYRAMQSTYYHLYGDGKALELTDIAQTSLHDAKSLHPFMEEQSEQLSSLYYQLEEVTYSIRQFIDQLHFDENRLNDIEARLNEINRLQKKYGPSVEAMLQYKEKITAEISEITNKDSHLESLTMEMDKLQVETAAIAEQLTVVRKQAASKLETAIQLELQDLYLMNATFEVDFTVQELDSSGADQVVFLLATNIGEPAKPLNKVASGGELSRIMLALQNIFAKHHQISTIIFDEIDTGVSGRVAQSIAEKMYEISKTSQVLCITHLPQVAAMSDAHLLIGKETANNRTKTVIDELTDAEKVQSIAQMMTGSVLTDSAIEHTEKLLALSIAFKNSYKKS